MTEFDRTEAKYIEQVIEQSVQMPQIGIVQSVEEHTSDDDFSNFEVNVLLRDEVQERRNVPVAAPGAGMVHVPKKEDMVMIHFLDEHGSGEFPIVTQVLYNDQDRAPLAEAGTIRYNRGDLYIEMHPDGDWARVSFKPEGDDATPKGGFEISEDGSFKIGDGSGYGIVSDGNGNFTWYEKSVDFVDDGSKISW